MTVKDLFTTCDKDKLVACTAEKYRDAFDGVLEAEEVAARYLPVLEELATITPTSNRTHFVLGVRGDEGVEAVDFYAPVVKQQLLQMAAMQGLTEEVSVMEEPPDRKLRYDKYFYINRSKEGNLCYIRNYKAIDQQLARCGFFLIGETDFTKTTAEVLELYRCRDVIEKSFTS